MKPSEIDPFAKLSLLPFVGTFDRTEAEFAAGLVVYGLTKLERTFDDPISFKEIIDLIENPKNQDDHMVKLSDNPYLAPDIHSLIKKGFVSECEGPGEVKFTERGLEKLKPFIGELPFWASGRASGSYLEINAQLCTRDGRVLGNARVESVDDKGQATIATDVGSILSSYNAKELESMFHKPEYLVRKAV